jgi:hypothetical protein
MGEGKPVWGDANPVSDGHGIEGGQRGSVGDFGDQMPGDRAFVPVVASAFLGPQGLLEAADREADCQWKDDDWSHCREDSLDREASTMVSQL